MFNNEWTPPELDIEDILLQRDEINKDNMDTEHLLLLQVEPYIDSLLLHLHGEEKDSIEVMNRFVFRDGYIWTVDEEKMFVKYCLHNPRCGCTYEWIDYIYQYYVEKNPTWNLKRYYTDPFKMLDHIYHCMRRNSAKEMLYKSELHELAANIEKMDEINLLASKPTELYEGLSMRTLRALNCKEGAELISKAYNRRIIKDLQMKFQDIFHESLNNAQCRYLNYLITGNLKVGEIGRLFRSRKNSLSKIWHINQYTMFLTKEKYKEEVVNVAKALSKLDPIYEKYLDFNEFPVDERIYRLKEYLLDNKEKYDAQIRRSIRKRKADWQERGNGYVVRYPQNVNDFCRESICMGNCLLTYLEPFIYGDTDILFIRKENDVNKPFITMEIYENELMQAYHKFNEDCTSEEADWIRKYCDRHGIGRNRFRFNVEEDELY